MSHIDRPETGTLLQGDALIVETALLITVESPTLPNMVRPSLPGGAPTPLRIVLPDQPFLIDGNIPNIPCPIPIPTLAQLQLPAIPFRTPTPIKIADVSVEQPTTIDPLRVTVPSPTVPRAQLPSLPGAAPSPVQPVVPDPPATLSLTPVQQAKCTNLVEFTGPRLIGRPAIVDKNFVAAMGRIHGYAVARGIFIRIFSAFRSFGQTLGGAIVKPASRSNHFAGHALDMNVFFKGTNYNSRDLRVSNLINLPAAVRGFIQDIRDDTGLRWGGDFKREDPVHIDDNLNAGRASYKVRVDLVQADNKAGCAGEVVVEA